MEIAGKFKSPPLFNKKKLQAFIRMFSCSLLHGFTGGLGGAVNLAAHGFHVFSDSADGVAGGKAQGGGERQKGKFDVHGIERLKAAFYPASGSLSMRRHFPGGLFLRRQEALCRMGA
jgi:hypothetical protein